MGVFLQLQGSKDKKKPANDLLQVAVYCSLHNNTK